MLGTKINHRNNCYRGSDATLIEFSNYISFIYKSPYHHRCRTKQKDPMCIRCIDCIDIFDVCLEMKLHPSHYGSTPTLPHLITVCKTSAVLSGIAVVIFSIYSFIGPRYIESLQYLEKTYCLQSCLINFRVAWLPNKRIVFRDKHADLFDELPVRHCLSRHIQRPLQSHLTKLDFVTRYTVYIYIYIYIYILYIQLHSSYDQV